MNGTQSAEALTTLETLKVGDPVWVFDVNHRVYDKRDKSLGGTLIWREHWVKKSVVGETSRSWLIGYNERTAEKVPKRGPLPYSMLLNESDVDDQVWIYENRRHLSDAVNGVKDIATLRKIAELIGYKERHGKR